MNSVLEKAAVRLHYKILLKYSGCLCRVFLIVYLLMEGQVCAPIFMWRSENSLPKWLLSFHYVSPREPAQVGSKHLYPLSILPALRYFGLRNLNT